MQKKLMSLEGDILIIIATALAATYPLFLRMFPDIPTLTFLLAFQVVGAIVFFGLAVRQGFPRLMRRDILLLIALALVAIGHDLAFFMAYRLTSVANVAVAHQSVSIFLLLLAPLFLKEKIHRDEIVALFFALLGIAILYCRGVGMHGSSDVLGISLGLASGFLFACLFLLYHTLPNQKRGLTISVVNFWRYFISTLLLLPFAKLLGATDITADQIMPLVGFAILFAVIVSGIHHLGLHRARPLHSSILGKTEPVFVITFGFLFLHEVPTLQAVIGGILVAGSGLWLTLRTRGKL